MRSALRKLEAIHADTATTAEERNQTAAERAQREKERKKRLAKLSPYKQCEYRCLECIQQLRSALKECRECDEALGTLEGRDDNAASPVEGAEGGPKKLQLKASDMNRRTVLQQELARSRQAARRAHQQLQKLQREAQSLARASSSAGGSGKKKESDASGSEEDYHTLHSHIENAKRFYREEFNITVVTSQDDPLLGSGAGAAGAMNGLGREGAPLLGGNLLGEEEDEDTVAGRQAIYANRNRRLQDLFSGPSSPGTGGGGGRHTGTGVGRGSSREERPSAEEVEYINARQDAEFQQFFLQVQQNDELMDQALDRINAGVQRIRDNALGLQEELNVQSVLLNQTEAKVDRNQEDLHNMNRRLRHAIRDMDDASICSYILCLLALLLVLAVLVKVAG